MLAAQREAGDMQERVRAFEEWAVDVDREYQSKITLIGQL
jgi:hypothetical protein